MTTMEAPHLSSHKEFQNPDEYEQDNHQEFVLTPKLTAQEKMATIALKLSENKPLTSDEKVYYDSITDSPYFWENIRHQNGIHQYSEENDYNSYFPNEY